MIKKISAFAAALALTASSAGVLPYAGEANILNVSAAEETSSLPEKVDLSETGFFPSEVIDQGKVNSCAACASTYYQFTYEARKAYYDKYGVNYSNLVYSPTSTYSQANGGYDGGSTYSDLYDVLKYRGAVTMDQLNYDSYLGIEFEDKEVPVNTEVKPKDAYYIFGWFYDENLNDIEKNLFEKLNDKYYRRKGEYITADEYNNLNENEKENYLPIINDDNYYYRFERTFTNIPNNEQDLLDALKIRLDNYKTKRLGTDLNEDEFINYIKEKLNEGKVVAATAHYGYNFKCEKEIDGKKYDIVYQNAVNEKSGYHALTIAGYDDNFEFDINGNGEIEENEKGAFKVYNSYGKSWGGNGVCWLMYDSVYKTSRVENCPDANSIHSYDDFDTINVRESSLYDVFTIDVSVKDVKLVSEVVFDTDNYFGVSVYNSCGNHYIPSIKDMSTKKALSYSGPVLTDITDLCSDSRGDRGNGRAFRISLRNNNNSMLNIKSICIKDDKGKVVASKDLNDQKCSSYFEDYLSISLPRGDMNYDGAYDSDDYAVVKAYFADPKNSDLSQFQLELLDANDDGVRDENDLAILSENMAD